jgi:hexosaminidase
MCGKFKHNSSTGIMKRLMILTFLVGAILWGCSKKEDKPSVAVNIVPKPAHLQVSGGSLALGKTVTLVAKTEDEKRVASFLAEYLKGLGVSAMVGESASGVSIQLNTVASDSLGAEGYTLVIDDKGVTIAAPAGAGLFYGAQTLIQVFPVEVSAELELPYVSIGDSPRFAYRGLHLDVSRHMFSVEAVKKYIDLASRHKFNRFHWHLTDDQGWRIEIKKYPKLQEVGAYRDQTVVGHAGAAKEEYDGKRYGGFYTQEEVKDVVQYAADRYITVIPEIEMPGHGLAALAAYPELGCTGGPYKTGQTFGVFTDVYCAGKESTFKFMEAVLDEVIPLFPARYVHIGGDECPKDAWKKCPNCQKRIKTEKLKDEHALQSYFVQRMEKYLNSKGKQIIGWDEILEGGLAPNATVMSWRGEAGGIEAAKQNHDVIMTPTKWCYFDYLQDTTGNEPLSIGGYLPVKLVYSYEPLPAQLSAEENKHILGAQANMWSEYIPTPEHLEYMAYPRACAMAEVVWSPREGRSYDDFLVRMATHVKRLDAWHVNYAKHIVKEFPQEKQ